MLAVNTLTGGRFVRKWFGAIFPDAQSGDIFEVGKLQTVGWKRGWILPTVCVYPFGQAVKSLVKAGVIGYEHGRRARLGMIFSIGNPRRAG